VLILLQEVAVFISFFVSAVLHEVNLLWQQTLVIYFSVFKLSLLTCFSSELTSCRLLG
jgi:hypothetical protein